MLEPAFSLRARLIPALLAAAIATSACGEVVIEECLVEPPPPQDSGDISVSQYPPGATIDGSRPSTLHASFLRGYVGSCAVVDRESACELHHCDRTWSDVAAAVDAGKVTVTGGLLEAAADLDPTFGYSQEYDSQLFEPGDLLHFDVAGSDEVEPVSVTLEAPPLPVVPRLGLDRLVRSKPLEITWDSAPGAGTVRAIVANYPDSWRKGSTGGSGDITEAVTCEVDVSEGKLTIPATLLEQLTPGAAMQADVQVFVVNREVRERDGWRLNVSVGSFATMPDGGMYWFSMDLQ